MAYREIVTKAVIAKGKKKYKNEYEITVDEEPTTVLGLFVYYIIQAKGMLMPVLRKLEVRSYTIK